MAAIQATRDDGVAIETEQSVLGYACVAAGLRDSNDRVVGGVGVTGRTDRLVAHRLTRPLLSAVCDIDRALRQHS
jgi:DNA-binding IclR family transcriptional regulator